MMRFHAPPPPIKPSAGSNTGERGGGAARPLTRPLLAGWRSGARCPGKPLRLPRRQPPWDLETTSVPTTRDQVRRTARWLQRGHERSR